MQQHRHHPRVASLLPQGDPRPEQESESRRDPARPPGPAGHPPSGLLGATHAAMAAAGWSAPAARAETSGVSACPNLSPRPIAVTGIWADLEASVERPAADLCATLS
jgi:hypothetical protein